MEQTAEEINQEITEARTKDKRARELYFQINSALLSLEREGLITPDEYSGVYEVLREVKERYNLY